MRKPTPDDLAILRRLLAAAGSKAALNRWIKVATEQKPKLGAPKKRADDLLLPGLELFVRLAEQQLRMKRTVALKWFADAYKTAEPNVTVESIWQRLNRKLKKSGFKEIVWPPGIDPSRFTFKALDDDQDQD